MFFILNTFGSFPRSLILFIILVIDLTKSVPAMGGLKISLTSPRGSRHFPFFKDFSTFKISFSVQDFDFKFLLSSSLFSHSFCCNKNNSEYSFFAGLCLNLCVKVSKYKFLIPFGSVTNFPLMLFLAAGTEGAILGKNFLFYFPNSVDKIVTF